MQSFQSLPSRKVLEPSVYQKKITCTFNNRNSRCNAPFHFDTQPVRKNKQIDSLFFIPFLEKFQIEQPPSRITTLRIQCISSILIPSQGRFIHVCCRLLKNNKTEIHSILLFPPLLKIVTNIR